MQDRTPRLRTLCLALALVLAVGLPATVASAKKVKPRKMTCQEFVALDAKQQPAVVAYLDGYAQGGKTEQEIGELDVDREIGAVVKTCKTTPHETLAQKIAMHLPGGKKLIKPAKMTCQEYMAVDSTKQPLAYYFAAGYDHATRKVSEEDGEIDLDTTAWSVVEDCKTAPKESVWAKLKKRL
jgi:acid stress chaperone HdeA